ncbi:MAG: hypothetical protein IBX44_03025 [Sulfurospirillum sp.]|nr:hypothetical protein [Sulfurospirillum sp.]
MAFSLFFAHNLRIPVADTKADQYFSQTITQASIAYATVRTLNATVSIIQESKLQLEPAGIGVSLAVGQVLDPLNDMVERVSNVLVFSIASLGVQKLLFEITLSFFASLAAILLIIISLLSLLEFAWVKIVQKAMLQFAILLIVARICLPFSALANDFLAKNFFEPRINQANLALEFKSNSLKIIEDIQLPSQGTFSILTHGVDFLTKKATDLQDMIQYLTQNASNMIENLLTLTFLYASIFLVQVLLLPLFTFWILIKSLQIIL